MVSKFFGASRAEIEEAFRAVIPDKLNAEQWQKVKTLLPTEDERLELMQHHATYGDQGGSGANLRRASRRASHLDLAAVEAANRLKPIEQDMLRLALLPRLFERYEICKGLKTLYSIREEVVNAIQQRTKAFDQVRLSSALKVAFCGALVLGNCVNHYPVSECTCGDDDAPTPGRGANETICMPSEGFSFSSLKTLMDSTKTNGPPQATFAEFLVALVYCHSHGEFEKLKHLSKEIPGLHTAAAAKDAFERVKTNKDAINSLRKIVQDELKGHAAAYSEGGATGRLETGLNDCGKAIDDICAEEVKMEAAERRAHAYFCCFSHVERTSLVGTLAAFASKVEEIICRIGASPQPFLKMASLDPSALPPTRHQTQGVAAGGADRPPSRDVKTHGAETAHSGMHPDLVVAVGNRRQSRIGQGQQPASPRRSSIAQDAASAIGNLGLGRGVGGGPRGQRGSIVGSATRSGNAAAAPSAATPIPPPPVAPTPTRSNSKGWGLTRSNSKKNQDKKGASKGGDISESSVAADSDGKKKKGGGFMSLFKRKK
eukprot:GHVU01011662.1.p1 GENE.GHVU01011662.1~~GHVU01011662.1.p1  ORF type:complete len:544 (+),score=95.06 GHVU01011662.1:2-1633(+)